jgi:DnaD/phage-associated family protein
VTGFSGFPDGKLATTRLPNAFFSDLLPQIDHLAELKVTLYTFWALEQQASQPKYLTLADYLADELLLTSLDSDTAKAEEALLDAIERAVIRGTLLRVSAPGAAPVDVFLFLNSEQGRQAAEGLAAGTWQPDRSALPTLELSRPNIYRLYEQNIGPLTPLIADALRDAEHQYPPEWIADAIQIATERNARNWKYIQAILRSWKEKGRDESHQRDTEKDRRRYIKGEFGDVGEY